MNAASRSAQAREDMLNRLETFLGAGNVPPLPPSFPAFPQFQERAQQFRRELEEVGGQFIDGRGREPLLAGLEAILTRSGGHRLYWDCPESFKQHGLVFEEPHLKGDDLLLFSEHPDGRVRLPILLEAESRSRENLINIEASVTSASCGIAETGSIVERVVAGGSRVLPVLPPTHVVLLRADDLLANHRQLFERIQPGAEGSTITIVTGPSRTADIEKTLILGVHGPRSFYVILTD